MALSPRKSGELVASLANHVKIKEEGVLRLRDVLVEEVKTGRLSKDNFSQNEVHPNPDDPRSLDWLFVVDTLNFCFWTREGQTKWTVDGHTGYFALCAAINRALRENVDILDPKFYSKITSKQLSRVLRSDTEVQAPLLIERVNCLHEVGECLLEKFDGSFANVVKKCSNSATGLLDLIVTNFKCFKDEASYKGYRVALYKRAQILVGDVWACFKGQGVGYFPDIDQITMFADYRVPQSLLYYGVFEYGPELMELLKRDELLENGDEKEVEIRACSICAVEMLKDHALKYLDDGHELNAVLIDHFLWDFRRRHADKIDEMRLPFHKTLSIYY